MPAFNVLADLLDGVGILPGWVGIDQVERPGRQRKQPRHGHVAPASCFLLVGEEPLPVPALIERVGLAAFLRGLVELWSCHRSSFSYVRFTPSPGQFNRR